MIQIKEKYICYQEHQKKIKSIPDKSKWKFKIIKWILSEIKNSGSDQNFKKGLGPGTYNIFQNWETLGVM